jgi:hypothetical protein
MMNRRVAWFLMGLCVGMSSGASAAPVNLIINPDFARTYAAQRLMETNQPYVRGEHKILPGYTTAAFQPYGWAVVPEKDGQGTVSVVDDEGRPALRIQAGVGEKLRLRQQSIEVVPGAAYVGGISAKGTGQIKLLMVVAEPAPQEVLLVTGFTARAGWQVVQARKTIGLHRHLAAYLLDVAGPADVLLRGAELSAEASGPAPDTLLQQAPARDSDTLYYEGFDGASQTLALNPGAALTDALGGRFGRGLATSPQQGGSITRLPFGDLPEKGTLEFWFKPVALPAGAHNRWPLVITTQTPGMADTSLRFDFNFWFADWGFGFRKGYVFDRAQSMNGVGWGWWQTGTWHHVAGSWDGEVMRVYLDGVLEGVCYGKDKMMPRGKALDLILAEPGVIDEIRISRGLRYGPVIPKGAVPVSYLPPAAPAEQASVVVAPVRDTPAADLDRIRTNAIAPMPKPQADHVFEAGQAACGWDGMAGLTVRSNHFGAGAHGVVLDAGREPGRAAYWRMEGVSAGSYYVGLWVESGDAGRRTEYWPASLRTTAYLNGWPLRFTTTTDPVQVRPGVWLLELQTARPVDLKPGDELAFAAGTVSSLALYRKEPLRGHGVTGQSFGVDHLAVQRLRLVLQPEIAGTGQDGTEHSARITVGNPLPYAVDAELTWTLADYYGAPLMQKVEPVHLQAHGTVVISNRFTAVGDARAYQLDVRSRPAPGFKFPIARPVEMLDLGEASRLEFLPNQPDPLTVWNHARKDLVDDRTGDRKRLCLDGNDWQWAYLDGRRVPEAVPAGLAYRQGPVPYTQYWMKLPPERFGKWYRKQLVVPAWMSGTRHLLELSQVQSEATIFVNGQKLGYGIGSLPVWTDITAALKPGATNELLICVRGGISLMKPDYVDKYDPENWRAVHENQDLYDNGYGSPCLKSVYLHTAPAVRVKQNLVIADTERRMLRIMTRLENASGQTRQVTLGGQVFQNGKPIAVSVPEVRVTVTNGSVAEVTVEAPAGALRPWTPQSPTLARLVTTVRADGQVLDAFERRFGYRDVRVQGTDLRLNGAPIRFFGVCLGFQPHSFYEQDNGTDFDRADPDDCRDLYDEIGVPHLSTVWTCSAQNWPRLNNDKYWDSWRHFVLESVWEKGSHPAVAGWQVSCESFHYTIYTAGKEGQEKHGERIYAGVQALRKSFWPNYWCVADGDETLGGRLDFSTFHYLNHGSVMGGFNYLPDGGFYGSDGVAHFTPDSFFLSGAATAPRKGTVLRMNPDWIYGSTACGATEDFEFWGMHNGVPAAKLIGDRAAVSAAYQFLDPRGMAWTKTAIEGYRDMEQALVGCVYWKSFLGLAEQDVAFIMPGQEIRYYAGSRFDRRVNLHDDSYLPGKLEFRWNLRDPSGTSVRDGRIRATSSTCFLKRDRIAFDIPAVSTRTAFTLNLEIWKDGRKWGREERRVEAWPAFAKGAVEKTAGKSGSLEFAVFDPANAVLPILAKLGVAAKSIATLNAEALKGVKALIIGPGCITPALADKRDGLRDFVRDGGRVLMLRQDDASLLPPDVTLEKKAWFSMGFVRAGNHPVMQGLRDMDFQMWNPGHVIAKGAFRKPDKGAFLTLLDSGLDGSMAWTEMLEFHIGRGSILATQLELTENFDTEPMCADLLKRLVAYLSQPVFRAAGQTQDVPLAVVTGASEAVLKRLGEVRTDYVTVTRATADHPVTLIDLGVGIPTGDAAAWRAYVEQGGTLVVHRAMPAQQAWLEALTGKKVRVEVQPYQSWVDRQMLERRDGLMTGVNNLDLYWRSQLIGESWEHHWQVSCGVEQGLERGQVQYVARVEGVADYLFPGGLVDVPVGKGRVIIDQLKWEVSSKDMICGSPARVLSMLLTNLGVARKLPAPKPALPKGVTYETIDLAAAANRGFVDARAGDGVGWLDWGAEADLSAFPTGRVWLAGVPYAIAGGDKNAVVLRAFVNYVKSLANYPDAVTLPVNKSRVAGLWFLHTGGWAGGVEAFGSRDIVYADGTVESMRLDGSNMADWNPGHEQFPDEEGTLTSVAWTGACKMYPVCRVYHTLWVNPHPDKTIKQVVIRNTGLEPKQWRFIPHLGLTAAILPAAAPVVPRDADKSRRFAEEGRRLVEGGKPVEAAEKLEAALRADDRNTAAWMTLANLRAETDTVAAFTALCERWLQASPENYQAYNLLGQYLEKKSRFAEALAAYRKSLEIEWNQPPTGAAVNRLEKKVNNP